MGEKKLFYEVDKASDFHSVVMTTFSFDFHHFESQVLRPLKGKGITNINIFADTKMLDLSIGFSTGHLKSLSASYSINGVPSVGAFHPKITFMAGENDVMLLQGSGNITNGGHGKNHELFSVFYANNEDQTQLPLIQEAWNYVRQITRNVNGLSSDKLDWVSNNCNLLDENPSVKHQFYDLDPNFSAALLYNEESSIWQQVLSLLPNENIRNIKIFSPFYDEAGTFLKQLSSYFNGCQIDAFLQPKRGIHPFKMEFQNNIRFWSWDSVERSKMTTAKFDRKLHSKTFWFDAGNDQYALFGSPNATIKAFGTETYRGANEEFAVLIKVVDQNILQELGLNGEYIPIQPQKNIQEEAVENRFEEDQHESKRKIKLLGVDQDGKNLTLYIKETTKYKSAICAIYNHWGEELEQQVLHLSKSKIDLELTDSKNVSSVAYVQFIDDKNEPLSNKQIVNSFHDLWNTNPSVENRKLMKLGSYIELGKNKLFDVITYFNDIQSDHRQIAKKSSRGSSGIDEAKEKKHAASITYEEAVALSKEPKELQHLLKQHSSIRIWDANERYFKELAAAEEEEDMNDEEQAKATKSRKRKEKKERTAPVELNSVKVLNSRRYDTEKFLNSYLIGLKKSINTEKYELGLIDLAMFLIVMKHLVEFTERKVTFKIYENDEKSQEFVLFPLNGNLSELTSFSGAILNLFGHFINLLCHADFQDINDEYLSKKLDHYKTLVRRTSLFSLAIINENYKYHEHGRNWSDLLALNIIDSLGKPENGFEKHLEEFLKNTSINGCNVLSITAIIMAWNDKYDRFEQDQDLFYDKTLGICQIVKQIPLEGPIKFLKLGRPGFEYNHETNEFVLSKLYNYKTGELNASLQKYNKSKLIK